jgi:methionyl-tRNA formyltransferase
MNCTFSFIPFRALIEANLAVTGVIIPRPPVVAHEVLRFPYPQALPMLPGTLIELAHARHIPVIEVESPRTPDAFAALEALQPDVIVCACFPHLLPRRWLNRPRRGCLNLHPSLLPAYRGPEPLFWQFHNGEARTGVTLHVMDEGADTGDIIAQAKVPFPDGIYGAGAEALTAEAGARLLIDALREADIPRRPQPREGASYAPRPTPADLVISTTWSARRAFNFIRGATEWGPFEVQAGGRTLNVRAASGYALDEELGEPYRWQAGEVLVQFKPGIVRLRTAPTS